MTNPKLTFCSRSHRGKIRKNNQDALAVQEELLVGAIADGIGGGPYGDVASQLAVDACIDYLSSLKNSNSPSPDTATKELANAVKFANEAIITVQANDQRYKNMGTTLSCFWLKQSFTQGQANTQGAYQLHYSWVGDSRIYRIRLAENIIEQLTEDHTLNPEKIDARQAPKLHKRASSILTQKVGSILLLKPDTGSATVLAGDIILACTDGLSDRVEEARLLEHAISHQHHLDKYADHLLEDALDRGGQDNISFIVAQLTNN